MDNNQPQKKGTGPLKGVPDELVPLYQTLSNWLDQFQQTNQERGSPADTAPIFGAHLLAADSNRGKVLLSPLTKVAVRLLLRRFDRMGVSGITIVIGYPTLLPHYDPAGRYLAFYKWVAKAVRQRGMKLLVEHNVLFVNSVFSPVKCDFSGLTFEAFAEEQQRMAQLVIDALQPDYLTILHEPQTFTVLAGLDEFRSPELATHYVESMLSGLRRKGTKVGAGAGNWDSPEYFTRLAKTTVDYLSLHIYNVSPSGIERAYAVAELGRSVAKPVVLTESWLFKSDGTDAAAETSLSGWEAGFRRDVFRYWEPLDRRFIENLGCYANSCGVEYVSPFWTDYFFSYVQNRAKARELPYFNLINKAVLFPVARALVFGSLTQPGRAYERLCRSSAREN